jgi:outer membrane protein OmpA-like peptidoglycan-associated protein
MSFRGMWITFALLFAGAAWAQEIELQVELTKPVGTDISRKGDPISAKVLSPAALQGDTVEGKITDSKSSGKMKGQSTLRFTFETLKHGSETIPISSQVRSISNSKGQVSTDEEGRVTRESSNLPKAIAGTGLGGLIGGIAGGGKGAAIGAAAGAVASIYLIEVAAEGPNIQFNAGSRVVLSATSRGGPELSSLTPNAAPAPVTAAASAPAQTAAPTATSTAAPAQSPAVAPQAGGQPDLKAVKADFIPGDKTIFYDDFTDMAGDEPPPHWKVRGGSMELKTAPGIRQLTTASQDRMTVIPNLTNLPKNFTMEAEVKFDNPQDNRLIWAFASKADTEQLLIWSSAKNDEFFFYIKRGDPYEEFGRNEIKVDWNQPVLLALWLQNGRLRFYVNGQRLLDVNQISLSDLISVEARFELGGDNNPTIGFRRVRFAESSPDFSQVISSSGRYVTHGILFDTDSDRLKPESAPVIKLIAQGLEKNPALKLLIEGHTDSVGNADHNLDLSKRRAEAVKAVLVSQFAVDAARLTTAGLGATKPVGSNDTPDGRAQNRRVEFVKQ